MTPERYEVDGCRGCPAQHHERCLLAQRRDVTRNADDSRTLAPAHAGMSPTWCPLRRAPTLLVMA